MKLFEYNNFKKEDFERALNNVKNLPLEEVVIILRKSLEEAYGECLSFPSNCCDFSSAVGTFLFKELGYPIEYWTANILSAGSSGYGHSFLRIRELVIDFTIDQFGTLEPGIISWEDFEKYYDNPMYDMPRTKGNKYPTFEQVQDHNNNFVVMVMYQAIDAFIKLNLSKDNKQ